MADDDPLEGILTKAIEGADGDKVSLKEIIKLYDDRSFGPIFCLLGLLVVLPPLGAIPGLPAAIGAVILLFSLQMLLGRSHVWLPNWIGDLSISAAKLSKAQKRSENVLRFIDGIVTERLNWATTGAARALAAALVSLLAFALIPLELVPFAGALPGIAIVMVGLALLARDGALMLAAFSLSAAALTVLFHYSPVLSWLGLA